ncbi:hypothetical protein [Alkalihalobacillus sp. LMS39]|uniref:hypothetical protein n=1 Tax=Alkalihalobacillus sp. LMS39 TaxID=2924032 RepID=UPI001FB4F946|nr:hypothetical protein [Alkalihalobacillus sp. LMS39]UOE94860.1 hypothetical protein MM271_04210 [Alkalihalobacillus sp. LMS39]
MTNILVVGAAGILGQMICNEVIQMVPTSRLLIGDYKKSRGEKIASTYGEVAEFHYVDVHDELSIEKALLHIDFVIVAVQQEEPLIQKMCIKQQIPSVDVTVFHDFVQQVKELHPTAIEEEVPAVVMAGFFPGLSGVMVNHMIQQYSEISEVHVALLQNTNAKAGITGIIDMLSIISKVVECNHRKVQGFSKKRKMDFQNLSSNQEVRLIHHDERKWLQTGLGIDNVYYWTAWNKKAFTILLAILVKTGLIKKIKKQHVGSFVRHHRFLPEHVALTVEVIGKIRGKVHTKTCTVTADSDYGITASVAVAIAKQLLTKKESGVLFPYELVTLDDLLLHMKHREIKVEVK